MEPYNYGPRRRSTSPSDANVPQFPQSPGDNNNGGSGNDAGGPGGWNYGPHHPGGAPPHTMPTPHSPSSGTSFAPPPGPPPTFPQAGPHVPDTPAGRSPPPPPPPSSSRPPAYSPPASAATATATTRAPPPSGYRVPLNTTSPFPSPTHALEPVSTDLDGHSPIYLGSAIFPTSVHPCKVAPHLAPTMCRVPYGGTEHEHRGRFDLLPFDPERMEWVDSANGRIPVGRRPVEGGYEEHGAKLYHALAPIQGVNVPGKTGEHLVRPRSLPCTALRSGFSPPSDLMCLGCF